MANHTDRLWLPPVPTLPKNYTLASDFVERIEKWLRSLESDLQTGERAQMEVILSNGTTIYPEWFGYHNPDLVAINGMDGQRRRVTLLLHKSSLQILVTAIKQDDGKPKQVIGFQPKSESPAEGKAD